MIVLSVAPTAAAQQAGPSRPGQISVIMKGEDGTVLSGASILLRRTSARDAPVRQRTAWRATASATGTVDFDDLPNGQYSFCAQAASGYWLNPCEWGAARPSVMLSTAQRTISTALVLKRGAAVSIRVNDPTGLLAQHEGKTPGAHLLLGVRSDALIFHPASISTRDSGGRTYEVTVPFDAKINLTLASSFFRLTDKTGVALAATGAGNVPLTVPSGQAPPTLYMAVSGLR
jgi:hypothetical protein